MDTRTESREQRLRFSGILGVFFRYRKCLRFSYYLALGILSGLTFRYGYFATSESLIWFFGESYRGGELPWGYDNWQPKAACISGYLLLHLGYLHGGGRIRNDYRARLRLDVVTPLLIGSLLLGTLFLCIVYTLIEIGEFWGHEINNLGFEGDWTWRNWVVTYVLAVLLLSRCIGSRGQAHALVRINDVVLVAAMTALSLALSTELAVRSYGTGGWFPWFNYSNLALAFSTPILILSIGQAIHLLEYRPAASRTTNRPHPPSRPANSARFVASARHATALLLLSVLLGTSQAIVQCDRLDVLASAREAFAADAVWKFIFNHPRFLQKVEELPDSDTHQREAIDELFAFLKRELLDFSTSDVPWADVLRFRFQTDRYGFPSYRVDVVEYEDDRVWTELVPVQLATWLTDEGAYFPAPPSDRTRNVARRVGLNVRAGDDFVSLLPRLQGDLLEREVNIGSSGIGLRSHHVVWGSLFATFVLLAVARDRVRRALQLRSMSNDAAWIVLDSVDAVATTIAATWGLALVVGPWLLSIEAIRATILSIHAVGPSRTLLMDSGSVAAIAGISGLMAAISVSLVSDLISLREVHQQPWRPIGRRTRRGRHDEVERFRSPNQR